MHPSTEQKILSSQSGVALSACPLSLALDLAAVIRCSALPIASTCLGAVPMPVRHFSKVAREHRLQVSSLFGLDLGSWPPAQEGLAAMNFGYDHCRDER